MATAVAVSKNILRRAACSRPLRLMPGGVLLNANTRPFASLVYHKSQAAPNVKNGDGPSVEGNDYLKDVLTARVYDVCQETPLQAARGLSNMLGNQVLLKREDLQPVFSFKLRGAYNKLVSLTDQQKAAGVVCCSAGNHAQGVAMAAAKLHIDAVIVMPIPTPSIKVEGVRKHGGSVRVVLHGNNYDEAQAEAIRLMKEENRTMVHPYDDPAVIAGQGTVGMEIVKQTTSHPPHAIFACVGGGGLVSGIAAYVKRIRPETKIIGVEAEDAAAMTQSLIAGKLVTLDSVGLFADGAAVKRPGVETFRLCTELVDSMVTCTTDEICAAIRDVFNETRTVMEGAGVLSVAGMRKYIKDTGIKDEKLVAVLSGANMNFDRLRFVTERAVANEALISVKVPEQPGSFKKFYSVIHPRGITEFSYRYGDESTASIMASFVTSGSAETVAVVEKLRSQGMEAMDLTHNELAKLHARYIVGGRSNAKDEVLYRFEFPEVPGALGRFLHHFSTDWNISLFHYRNHGHDVGQVLIGMQVQPSERQALQQQLDSLGYRYTTETANPFYQAYLR